MNAIDSISQAFFSFLSEQFNCSKQLVSRIEIMLNTDPKKASFGDMTTNAALLLVKQLGRPPREIAQQIISQFSHPSIITMNIAGPGFININLSDQLFAQMVGTLCNQPETVFRPNVCTIETTNIEFISANPTGPLHFGHGRGGIIGDVLGRVIRFSGQSATTEFYINDAGSQIEKLGDSFKIRCFQQLGQSVKLPENAYHGSYLIELAEQLIAQKGEAIRQESKQFFAEYAKTHLLAYIKGTLEQYRIGYDVWFSEKLLHTSGAINKAVEHLTQKKHTYQEGGALWFRSTTFGDDKDRVLKRADGSWTYAAADIAYLLNKASRGFNRLIMVLGQDHHSYATRLQNFARALELDLSLTIILYQLVRMKQGGKLVQMSKRSGSMITLSEVIDDVGTDAARFFYLYRKAEAQLEFDLDLARKKSNENPVYYVQYAYVRTGSILQKAFDQGIVASVQIQNDPPIILSERQLIRKMAQLERVIAAIARSGAVHTLAYYAVELADLFHAYYNNHRVIDAVNLPQTQWRLALITALRNTFSIALDLLGINKPERM